MPPDRSLDLERDLLDRLPVLEFEAESSVGDRLRALSGVPSPYGDLFLLRFLRLDFTFFNLELTLAFVVLKLSSSINPT